MSTNKKVVSTTKSVLQSLNKEVKTSEVYQVYSQLCGYKGWQVASAKEVEFSPIVQLKLKEKLLNKINAMEPSLEKLFSLYLLDEDGERLHNELKNIKTTPAQIDEALDRIANLNQSLLFYRKLFGFIAYNVAVATRVLANQKCMSILTATDEALRKEENLSRETASPKKKFEPKMNYQIKSADGVFVMEDFESFGQSYGEEFHAAVNLILNNDSKLNFYLKGMTCPQIVAFLSHDKVDHSKILSNSNILMTFKEKGIYFINNQGEVWTGGAIPFTKINEITIKHYGEEALALHFQSLLKQGVPYEVERIKPRNNKDDRFIFVINKTKPDGTIKSFTITPEFISLSHLF